MYGPWSRHIGKTRRAAPHTQMTYVLKDVVGKVSIQRPVVPEHLKNVFFFCNLVILLEVWSMRFLLIFFPFFFFLMFFFLIFLILIVLKIIFLKRFLKKIFFSPFLSVSDRYNFHDSFLIPSFDFLAFLTETTFN